MRPQSNALAPRRQPGVDRWATNTPPASSGILEGPHGIDDEIISTTVHTSCVRPACRALETGDGASNRFAATGGGLGESRSGNGRACGVRGWMRSIHDDASNRGRTELSQRAWRWELSGRMRTARQADARIVEKVDAVTRHLREAVRSVPARHRDEPSEGSNAAVLFKRSSDNLWQPGEGDSKRHRGRESD